MMVEVVNQEIEGELFSFQAMFSQDDDSLTQDNGLLAYKAKADPDTMYLHEALKEPNREEFIKAMEKEIAQQVRQMRHVLHYQEKQGSSRCNYLTCGVGIAA
jgi:hypothetical protein